MITVKNYLKRREIMIAAIIFLILGVMSFATNTFLTVNNLMSIALGFSSDGFLALGMTFILISGQIDLSVGSMACLSSMIIGQLFTYMGFHIWTAILVAAVVCVTLGFITGNLVARLKIAPFIITLGMQGMVRGLCYVVSSGISITVTGAAAFRFLGSGYLGPIPVFFVILILAAALCQFLLRKTKFFSKVYFIGSNAKAAELAGIKVNRTKITLYMISALLACIAGALSTARFGVATPTLGLQAEGRAITAAVVGGTAMSGGEGSIVGTLLGLVMIHFISNGLVQLGVSVYWQDFASSALMVAVIVFDTLQKRQKRT